MKSTFNLFILMLTLIMVSPLHASHKTLNSKPFVIPELRSWKGRTGTFVIENKTKIIYSSKTPELKRIAKALADDYAIFFQKELTVSTEKAHKGDIELRLRSTKHDTTKEGYEIDIQDKVVMTSTSEKGLYWATRTLLQLSQQETKQHLPKGKITDYPDFGLRGLMLDVGRKYIPISYLRDLVKTMAYYKMNCLQIHLNDCEIRGKEDTDLLNFYSAFRLESSTYPGLCARDGYYTKQQFIDLQVLAESLEVEIIPEIDAPAHVLAFTHYRPELGSKKYHMDHFDLFNPEVYTFMDNLWKEYLEGPDPVFRGKRVHIGTDEYSNKDQQVVEQFRAYTDHYIRFVERYDKQACMWGSLTHAKGTTKVKVKDVIQSSWFNGYSDPKVMIAKGYQQISIPDGLTYIVPAAGYYFDYLNIKKLYNEWTPNQIGKAIFDYQHPAILGGMFAVWNDHVRNGISVKDIQDRLFPALQTLSAKFWTGKHVTIPFEEFDTKRQTVCEAPGVNVRAKIGTPHSCVFEKASIEAGEVLPYKEIGYDYTIQFHIKGGLDEKNTILFSNENSTFYLVDPIKGVMGYSRDGYLFTFDYRVFAGEEADICIEGNNKTTRLYVNGRLRFDNRILRHYDQKGKNGHSKVRTLVFPLNKAGNFKSEVSNLKVYNYMTHEKEETISKH